jgi:hypothetical protein
MSKKHTPGPWVAERDRAKSVSLYSGKTFVGEIYCEQDEPSAEELGNVQLAAAAPDLLEALKAAEKEIRRLHMLHVRMFEGKVGEPDLLVARQARKAINKAKGKK